ncbi:phosphopyruvate hydratase [Candidatus Woesearchaeota archaeon CG08_land_8_20_14_0_20_47_9]|nr:MAG: phosphopyruvate hydratase [Candidatus Woesearchaeota archaeon CG1_02_47_18]PIN75766.1 MAG: phosphopyruvate hydratase [Candidatus Woesearchaeota archaeon CG10_big_fil_rev_8_21_14_0_10_47_5]PIO03809.1 MAG: phosphopyruvate hydratase [Candidatus Woesearchaeota archaeon CG08_land_8_20_14_0_20_47_9]HII29860.1 phosphopyruvate hydratase [Candidatus Woesearchaeota archaeon]
MSDYAKYAIRGIKAREVLDSRGNPTVEATVSSSGQSASAIVPSGASTGSYEALELRDGGSRFLGKGVLRAVENVNGPIAAKLAGMDCRKQGEIDHALIRLDGTDNKSKLGANAILAVSIASSRLAASVSGKRLYKYLNDLIGGAALRLPTPFCNIINGGRHAGSRLKIQEFMIVPQDSSFRESARMASEVYSTLKGIVKERFGVSALNVGDEGGFTPQLNNAEQALDLVTGAIKKAGHEARVRIAVDSAASEFYDNSTKKYALEKTYSGPDLIGYYERLIEKYDIISWEDPFDQDDFDSFTGFTAKLGDKLQVVGDDLLVTNVKRIRKALKLKSCNALLLKLNQIGTLTESIDAAKLAYSNNWRVMVSHRSGETEDSFIADLSVALSCGQIKLGAPARGERTAKYNQLIRIEEELKED